MMDVNTIELNELSLGTKIRLLRFMKRWSQQGVAALTKTNQLTVSKFERGLPIDEADKARILDLFGISENK